MACAFMLRICARSIARAHNCATSLRLREQPRQGLASPPDAGLHARKLWSAQWAHFSAVRTMHRTGPVACTRAGSEVPETNGPSNDLKQHGPGNKSGQGPEYGKKRGTNSPIMSIPTVLTILRVLAIPPVVYLVQFPDPSAAAWATSVFVAASITDWLDGYLARKMNSSSAFGAFLDPVADKLMVCSVLVLLCTKTFATGLFATAPWVLHASAVAIICREVAMSALREYAATLGPKAQSVVAVNKLGKYKTALQLISLSFLLVAMNGGEGMLVQLGATVGPWTLLLGTALTWQSFISYLSALWRFM